MCALGYGGPTMIWAPAARLRPALTSSAAAVLAMDVLRICYSSPRWARHLHHLPTIVVTQSQRLSISDVRVDEIDPFASKVEYADRTARIAEAQLPSRRIDGRGSSHSADCRRCHYRRLAKPQVQ